MPEEKKKQDTLLNRNMINPLSLSIISIIVDNALQNAGLTEKVRSRVLEELKEPKWVDGPVKTVHTGEKRSICVEMNSVFVFFLFPPNTDNFETELIRAQQGNFQVGIWYYENSKNENILTSLMVFKA